MKFFRLAKSLIIKNRKIIHITYKKNSYFISYKSLSALVYLLFFT
ncbi:protein of unknown function [Xenorhabdus nematophila AN6/1]|nr:hypothetical protein XNA1_4640001 [Xenorhabdus nematophila str. Anatoliense]CEE95626.1 hypothetical protein XNA1_600001 [Xenorhabdus nematophila str. Anatoliense]CEF31463.1 hypothetical protein XNW1_3770001 [Xenorhabdus nematophila str. Websteri]CEK22426.1 protein of unknown function [Xenorhabdus nematophila AN6/1]